MSKKILVVTQYFWPENFRVNELVLGLHRQGHQIEILTSIPNYPTGSIFAEYKNNPLQYSSYNGIKVHRVKQILRGNNKFTLALNYISFVVSACIYSLIYLRKNHYDTILAIQLSPIFSVIPAILCKYIFKSPLYMWVLDIWPDSLFASNTKDGYIYKSINKVCFYIYSSAENLFLSSKGFKDRLLEMGIERTKLEYMPQWVEEEYTIDLRHDSIEAKEVKSILSRWSEKKIFLFAGNIGEAQDFDNVLLSFKKSSRLEEMVFLILGDGRYKKKLKQLINKHSLEENVFLLGRYSSKFMPYFYNYSSILVFSLSTNPIFSLTLPGKIQSYMSSGTTIIGMVEGESSAVINDAKCGFTVPSGDVNGFSKLIDRCCFYSDDELNSIGANGKEYAFKNFNYDLTIEKLSKKI